MWPIVDDAERAQWSFVPFEAVGPLRFGMGIEDVAKVMDAQGFVSSYSYMGRPHGALAQDACFQSKDAPLYLGEEAVTAYCGQFGEPGPIAHVTVGFDGRRPGQGLVLQRSLP
ncbi:hypothetical protein [Streptomyces sp. NPDC004680]|uniref:hypothetical protein n=1 Tax=Streptomyces sp. NPDC004680 TaxID=3154287 RepID=UPI0033BCBDB4